MAIFNGTPAAAGTITKKSILLQIVNRLRHFEGAIVTDIEAELRAVLYDISGRGDFLDTTDTVTTVAGTAGYTEPLNIRRVREVWIAEQERMVEGNYREYLKSIEFGSAATGVPEKWCRFNGKIYFFKPVAGGVYTANVDYWKFHANSTATIEYTDRFAEAIYAGVLSQLWGGQLAGLREFADNQLLKNKSLYLGELAARIKEVPSEPMQTVYRDV